MKMMHMEREILIVHMVWKIVIYLNQADDILTAIWMAALIGPQGVIFLKRQILIIDLFSLLT